MAIDLRGLGYVHDAKAKDDSYNTCSYVSEQSCVAMYEWEDCALEFWSVQLCTGVLV